MRILWYILCSYAPGMASNCSIHLICVGPVNTAPSTLYAAACKGTAYCLFRDNANAASDVGFVDS